MRFLSSLVATVALVGCVGGIDEMSDPPPVKEEPTEPTTEPPVNDTAAAAAKMLYETNVYPIVKAKCVSCHSFAAPLNNTSGFVTDTVTNAHSAVLSFVSVMGDYTSAGAPIVTKIPPAPNPTASHAAILYTTEELGKFDAWLAKELEAKTGTGNPTDPPPTESPAQATARVMGEWSACQTLELFDQANMTNWGGVGSDEGPCRQCHNEGVYGFVASSQAPNFFKLITEDKYFMLQYFTVDLTEGVAGAKMKINQRTFDAVGQGLPPHNEHPRFNYNNNNGKTALEAYYNLILQAKTAAGTAGCGPSKLKN